MPLKKILTAIGDSSLNEYLNQLGKYEVIGKDVQYKEGVLEVLKEFNNIDILILSKILDGEIDIRELIKQIVKINDKLEIIVFIDEEDKEFRNFLIERGIYKIYKNNQIELDEFVNVLDSDNLKTNEMLTEEIKKLKQIIEKQNLDILENVKLGKITSVIGNYGSRKKCAFMYIM